jgi:hypothetical protein
MSTTIFTAPEYHPEKQTRRRKTLVLAVSIFIIVGGLFYVFRFWPYEHRVNQFLTALENRDYQRAYALWQNDPHWQQHLERYKKYPFADFYNDWGPSGEWGIIKEHKIDGAASPKTGGTGVIVQVTVNQRVEPLRLWVERKDKTITWSPY